MPSTHPNHVAASLVAIMPWFPSVYGVSKLMSVSNSQSYASWKSVYQKSGIPCVLVSVGDSDHLVKVTVDGNEISFTAHGTGYENDALPFPIYAKNEIKIEIKAATPQTLSSFFAKVLEFSE